MKILTPLILSITLLVICFNPVYAELLSTQTYDVQDGSLLLYSFDFSPDGINAYFVYGPQRNVNGGTILVHYILNQPYDINNRTEQSRYNLSPNSFLGFTEHSYTTKVSDDGRFFYVFGFNANSSGQNIYKVTLETPFLLSSFTNLETINYDNLNRNHILHADFADNGNLLYTGHYYSQTISLWNLNNTYEISFDNLVSTVRLDVGSGLLPVQISHDGNYLINNDFSRGMQIYPLSNPFNINSIQNGTAVTPEILTAEFISDFEFINNGLSIFIKQNFDSMLYRYNFDTSYNLIDIPVRNGTSTEEIIITNSNVLVNGTVAVIGNVMNNVVERSGGSGCSGDCTYPTLGLDKKGFRIVEGGFSYNDNVVDAIPWHTPYPLITTETHKINEMIIKAWDNNTVRLIQMGLGIPEIGSLTDDAEILIEVWFEPYTSNIEELKIIDPHNLLKHPLVSVKSKMTDCRANNDEQCISIIVNYVYDKIPKYNIIKVDVMDFARNVQSTTFNDGIEIFGTVINDNPNTMMVNPPFHHPSKYQIEILKVSNTNDLWIDQYGYHWIGDKSKIQLVDDVPFVRHVDKSSSFGNYDRYNSNFEKMIQYEEQHAQKILEELYGNR